MTRLLIARHGNTFDKGDVLLRVGKHTDLPLSVSGKEQALKLGEFFKNNDIHVDKAYSSNLQRTVQTAQIALETCGDAIDVIPLSMFDEIDYGPDEGKAEDEVVARLGEGALKLWDSKAIPPNGWNVDVEQIKRDWQDFAKGVKDSGETILVVTSNGIARFAPYILIDHDEFIANNKIKLSTGAISCIEYENGRWVAKYWNVKP